MNKRQYVYFGIVAVIVAIAQSMYIFRLCESSIDHKAHLYMFYVYMGYISLDGVHFISALAFSASFFVQLCFLANRINEDFAFAATYIFTRTKRRATWLFKHYRKILLDSLILYLFQFGTTLVMAALQGYHFDVTKCLMTMGALAYTLVICNTILTIIAATVSVNRNTALVVSVFYLVYLVWLVLIPLVKASSVAVLLCPVSHALLCLHRGVPILIDPNIESNFDMFDANTSQITPLSTVIVIVVLSAALLIAGYRWINKKNILEGMN